MECFTSLPVEWSQWKGPNGLILYNFDQLGSMTQGGAIDTTAAKEMLSNSNTGIAQNASTQSSDHMRKMHQCLFIRAVEVSK